MWNFVLTVIMAAFVMQAVIQPPLYEVEGTQQEA